MTSRERWIVYPLLFLTFGITMRDKVRPQQHFVTTDMTAIGEISAAKINCNELDVNQLNVGRATVHRLESAQSKFQLMTLSGRGGRDAIRLSTTPDGTGRLELLAADGDVLVMLGGDEAGGAVTAIGQDQDIWLVLGHYGDQYGVFAESAEAGRRLPLTLPWQFETSLPDEVPADGPVEEERPEEEPVE